MKINFANVGFFEKLLIKRTLNLALKHLKQKERCEVEVVFVSKTEMQKINNDFRKTDSPTDVLSFPALELKAGQVFRIKDFPNEVNFDSENLMLGEIFICKEIALEQAAEFGHTQKRELAFLALHGFLHLLGFNHMDKDDEKQMIKTQDDILTKLRITREEKK